MVYNFEIMHLLFFYIYHLFQYDGIIQYDYPSP